MSPPTSYASGKNPPRQVLSMIAGSAVWRWGSAVTNENVMTDPEGALTTYMYTNGMIVSLARPTGRTSTYTYVNGRQTQGKYLTESGLKEGVMERQSL